MNNCIMFIVSVLIGMWLRKRLDKYIRKYDYLDRQCPKKDALCRKYDCKYDLAKNKGQDGTSN